MSTYILNMHKDCILYFIMKNNINMVARNQYSEKSKINQLTIQLLQLIFKKRNF